MNELIRNFIAKNKYEEVIRYAAQFFLLHMSSVKHLF
jgi:hypothetical protein